MQMGISKYLLENGAQMDVCSKGDLSTVWYATIQNKIKALKVLLENGAQVDQLFNRNGFSVGKYTEVVDVLLGSGAIKYQLGRIKMSGVLYCLPVDRDIRKFSTQIDLQENEGYIPCM